MRKAKLLKQEQAFVEGELLYMGSGEGKKNGK